MISKKLIYQLPALAVILIMMLAYNTVPDDKTGTALLPKRHVIEITGFKFQPEHLHVNVGDTIEWVNKDFILHTATAADTVWDTGEMEEGMSRMLVINKKGKQAYFCRYHPTMKGTLMVQ